MPQERALPLLYVLKLTCTSPALQRQSPQFDNDPTITHRLEHCWDHQVPMALFLCSRLVILMLQATMTAYILHYMERLTKRSILCICTALEFIS